MRFDSTDDTQYRSPISLATPAIQQQFGLKEKTLDNLESK